MARQKYSAYWCSVAAVIFLINVLAISIVGGHGADVPIQMAPSLPIPEHRHPPKKSRQRRFLLPSASGWVARLTFGLFIPVPDVNSVLALTLPLTYTIDTGTYVLTFFSRLQLGSSREGKDFQGSIALCFYPLIATIFSDSQIFRPKRRSTTGTPQFIRLRVREVRADQGCREVPRPDRLRVPTQRSRVHAASVVRGHGGDAF